MALRGVFYACRCPHQGQDERYPNNIIAVVRQQILTAHRITRASENLFITASPIAIVLQDPLEMLLCCKVLCNQGCMQGLLVGASRRRLTWGGESGSVRTRGGIWPACTAAAAFTMALPWACTKAMHSTF